MEEERGLKFLRFSLLISSISPVFILLAIKGISLPNDMWNNVFRISLFLIAILSFVPLAIRYNEARKESPIDKNVSSNIKPCTEEYSTYIISIALPLCQNDISNTNDLIYCIAMLSIVIFIFYIFNLYYLNIFFYMFNYRLYKIINENETFVLISNKKIKKLENTSVKTIKLTNSTFLDVGEQ